MPNNLPETMKALEITEYSGESSSFRFIEKQVPNQATQWIDVSVVKYPK